jgi:hypothetical protein
MLALALVACGGGGGGGGSGSVPSGAEVPANRAPVASTGGALTTVVGSTVKLDGSASSDPDGDPLTYKWTLTARPAGSRAALSSTTVQQPTLVPDVVGDYVVTLVVNDGSLDSAVASTTATATLPAGAPAAVARAPAVAAVATAVALDGTASVDAEGDTLSYRWTLVSKPGGSTAAVADATSATAAVVPDVEGSYTLRLIVNDGALDSAPAEVTFMAVNQRVARTPYAAPSGLTITVTESTVTDNGDGTKRYFLRVRIANDTAAAITDAPMSLLFDTGDSSVTSIYVVRSIQAGGRRTATYDVSAPSDWVPLLWQYDPATVSPRPDLKKLQWLMPIP